MLSRIAFGSRSTINQLYRLGSIQLTSNARFNSSLTTQSSPSEFNVVVAKMPESYVAKLKSVQEDVQFCPPHLPGMIIDPSLNDYDPKTQTLEDYLDIRFGPDMPTIHDETKPERDVVNFPRVKTSLWPEPCRLFMFPDSWFRFFYNKTGVTGPYLFGFGFTAFAVSKEVFVMDHDNMSGAYMIAFCGFLITKYGALVREWAGMRTDCEAKSWDDWQKGMIRFCDDVVAHEKKAQESARNQSILFDAKRENIALQLEAEYRRRLMVTYKEVHKRLEYFIAKQNAVTQYQQKHMANWIIENVVKAITPQQEKEALQRCVSDLKQLASKHQISSL